MAVMDKKLKAKWVKALRSGKYKQAKYVFLEADGNMSCLGVLADICGIPRSAMIVNTSLEARGKLKPLGVLPIVIRKTLSNKNDDGESFLQIADWIEQNL